MTGNLEKGEEVRFPTAFGEFKLIPYSESETDKCHLALIMGNPKENPIVRIHSECLTGDVFCSSRCDCGDQINKAMDIISKEGSGVIIYLRQEGRGIGLLNKLKAYALQDKGLDTVEANIKLGFEADQRTYGAAVYILKDLGLKKIRLLTNNPDKVKGLKGEIEVTERIPLKGEVNGHNKRYLATKKEKMGHEF
ncbi:MAG: GTP cyclohydrolase II [Candidatus Woesearchaeota archaeon]|nr:GTP cyclohydrolase II [Candidatus Woesearchaeota archaeon]